MRTNLEIGFETEKDLQAQLAEAKALVEELERQIEKQSWPKEEDRVWALERSGKVYDEVFRSLYHKNDRLKLNQVFRTKEDAENEVLFQEMRGGVRVTEKDREYWVPIYDPYVGFDSNPYNGASPEHLLAGLIFETQEECEAWIAKWGGTLEGMIP